MKTFTSFILVLAVQMLYCGEGNAQQVKITSGASCKTTGAASIIINNADLVNNGNFIASDGSTVTIKGTSALEIGGSSPSSFDNLTLDNSNGLTITNSETVNGTLTFTNGKITLGDNDLILSESASISGSGSSGYVITNGVGSLRQRVMNNATDVTYPVGLASEYLPVTIQLTVGSTADDISARVDNGLYTAYDESGVPAGSLITDHVVNKTWHLEETVAGGSNATVKIQWNAGDETSGFNRVSSDLGHYAASSWNYSTVASASGTGPYTQTLGGVTSFSPFGVYSPKITCAITTGTYCAGSPLSVGYTATGGLWNSGNTFTAQLSDPAGSFSAPSEIGSNASLVSGIIDATLPSASNDGTAYRIRVTSSNPSLFGENNGQDFTINQLRVISGNLTYYNLSNTPLLTDVKVKLYQDGSQVGSDYNVTDGTFAFSDLCPGDYELRVSSTKSTSGSVNTTDAAQVNYWGANPYTIEKVRFYCGDVTGGSFFINSSDAQLIKAHFVYGTPYNKGAAWTFWRTGQTISTNSTPVESYPAVSLVAGSNITANIYGLCTGDFNRSFSGGQEKASGVALNLVNNGTVYASANTEIELPLRIVKASTIGAISLILNFPAEMLAIQDVQMDNSNSGIDWTVTGNELRIGWFSQNPYWYNDNDELLTLKLKTSPAFITGNVIRFTLADNPLNELADENYMTIEDAVLSIVNIEASSLGIGEPVSGTSLKLSNHPNPFHESTTFSYTLPTDGRVTLEISNLVGNTLSVELNEYQQTGNHTLTIDPAMLVPGVYLATLRLISDNDVRVHTIKMVKAW